MGKEIKEIIGYCSGSIAEISKVNTFQLKNKCILKPHTLKYLKPLIITFNTVVYCLSLISFAYVPSSCESKCCTSLRPCYTTFRPCRLLVMQSKPHSYVVQEIHTYTSLSTIIQIIINQNLIKSTYNYAISGLQIFCYYT